MLAFTAPPPRPTVSPFFSLSHFPPQLSSAFETDANANARPRLSLPWAPPRPALAQSAASSAESSPSFLDVVEEEICESSDDNPFKIDIDIDSPVCIAPSELLPPPSPRPRARRSPILDAPRFSFPSTPFALLPSTTLPPISTQLPSISESDEDSEEDDDAEEAAWLPTFVHLPALRRPYTRKQVGPWRKARKADSLEWLRLATLTRCHQAGTLPGEAYGAIEVDMEL
ncbi:hypothetical protein Rhopal_007421-T1 [Rhodotorula paludigena]|uniref:Uncharacterized protein n=1 Tax=Rhodotorula paludigena TaxID=86838 RepID=A0AAV5GYB5_9BASI|nr:hypothetical protein Rhopal_007421-T1 [Rhodotorula paludigena]